MTIKAAHQSITTLFKENETFKLPKFQREYAWDEEAIGDFVEDIKKCVLARQQGKKRSHFFGGIVSARSDVQGSSRTSYEIIDGQQRISSFVMLVAAITLSMNSILDEIQSNERSDSQDMKARDYLETTIKNIKTLFLTHSFASDLEYHEVPKLTVSNADDTFFQSILDDRVQKAKRDSHRRILYAWKCLNKFISDGINEENTATEKAKWLQLLVDDVLVKDCTVIFMYSDKPAEAYRIFEVLNDRGVNLTNGDILRAKTLELLDRNELRATQDELVREWERSLQYPPESIDRFLFWYIASYLGSRPKQHDVTDIFMTDRLKESSLSRPLTKEQATRILNEVRQLSQDFALINQINDGDWPYESGCVGVEKWDENRLNILISQLKHTNAMPLLLALTLLDSTKFAEAVASLERFVFRFKIIGNIHIGHATRVYHKHAKIIRNDPNTYSIRNLNDELKNLVNDKVSDETFAQKIRELTYEPGRGQGNKYIRYFLMTINEYLKWYEEGANGTPAAKKKSYVMDFSNFTLEHIYPQQADENNRSQELEEVKHSLGNLTFLDPNENISAANKPFEKKRTMFADSNLHINRRIAENKLWTREVVTKRTEQLAKVAVKVFIP